MPFLTVKLQPGVHAEQTPLLLQAGIIQANNIRWRDGLAEKIGGWKKFYYSVPGQIDVATIVAEAAFTADYNGIAVPPNPDDVVAPGMEVIDTTIGQSLGKVASYGPVNVTQAASATWAFGATTINMAPNLAKNVGIIPGMTVIDDFLNETLGTVLTYLGSTLTLAAPAPFGSETADDNLTFTSGTDSVLVTSGPLEANSAGTDDTLVIVETSVPVDITPEPLDGPIRELWPWADFNGGLRLAAGGDQGLFVVSLFFPDITPRYVFNSISTYTFTTTAGSPIITVHNVDPNLTQNNAGALIFNNYVAIGGTILYGAYAVVPVNSTDVKIQAATACTTTVTGAVGVVSTFTTESNSQVCTVVLPNSTLVNSTGAAYINQGQEVAFLPTTLTGSSPIPNPDIVLQGTYTVLTTSSPSTFTIGLANLAGNSVGPIPENRGLIQSTTWIVIPAPVPGSAYGVGIYGAGGYGGGVLVTEAGTPSQRLI